jgi:hypothetical protein
MFRFRNGSSRCGREGLKRAGIVKKNIVVVAAKYCYYFYSYLLAFKVS